MSIDTPAVIDSASSVFRTSSTLPPSGTEYPGGKAAVTTLIPGGQGESAATYAGDSMTANFRQETAQAYHRIFWMFLHQPGNPHHDPDWAGFHGETDVGEWIRKHTFINIYRHPWPWKQDMPTFIAIETVLQIVLCMGASGRGAEASQFAEAAPQVGERGTSVDLLAYDFVPGTKRRVSGLFAAGVRSSGKNIAISRRGGIALFSYRDGGGREIAYSHAVARFDALKAGASEAILNPAISPDGEKCVAIDSRDGAILIATTGGVRKISTKCIISHPISWNPASSIAAFYYASTETGDDPKFQEHGVACVGVDGDIVAVLREPSPATATPLSDAKEIPLGWSAAGDQLFFTEAMQDNGTRSLVTQRINLGDRRLSLVAKGEFSDVSGDGSLAIVSGVKEGAKSSCWKIDLRSGERNRLPPRLTYPRLSPDGSLMACLRSGSEVVCVDTSSLVPLGRPIAIGRKGLMISDWSRQFRWITLPADSQPATRGE